MAQVIGGEGIENMTKLGDCVFGGGGTCAQGVAFWEWGAAVCAQGEGVRVGVRLRQYRLLALGAAGEWINLVAAVDARANFGGDGGVHSHAI